MSVLMHRDGVPSRCQLERCSIRADLGQFPTHWQNCSAAPALPSHPSLQVCVVHLKRTVGTTGTKQHGNVGVKLLINPILGVFPGLPTFNLIKKISESR